MGGGGAAQDPSSMLPPAVRRSLGGAFRAMPFTAKIRLVAIAALAAFMVASIVVMGVETRRRYKTHERTNKIIKETDELFAQVSAIIDASSATPTCIAFGQGLLEINTTFPDDTFGVHEPGDSNTIFRFDLGALSDDSMVLAQTVTVTIQDASGELAHLADIPPVTAEFSDLEFVLKDQAGTGKELRFDVSAVTPSTDVVMTVQSTPGIVAYLADMIRAKNIFLDSEFTIHNALDTDKKFRFDVGTVGTETSRLLAFAAGGGTIALVADVEAVGFPLSDGAFVVQNTGATGREMVFDLSAVTGGTTIEAKVPNKNGTIAYTDDVPPDNFVEVVIAADRSFPETASGDGGDELSELGDIYLIEISLCGGGGGGGDVVGGEGGGGGGSGSGVQNFWILNPADKYTQFDVVIGEGGAGGGSGSAGATGGVTILTGTSVSGESWYLNLRGYGGQGGQQGVSIQPGARGGSGASSGGPAVGVTLGQAGELGGLQGGLGGHWLDNPSQNGVPGPLTYPWRTGGGGGGGAGSGTAGKGAVFFGTSFSNDCPNSVGGSGCGANGLFGRGGTEASPNGALCAGGAGGSTENVAGDGGAGSVVIRYYLRDAL